MERRLCRWRKKKKAAIFWRLFDIALGFGFYPSALHGLLEGFEVKIVIPLEIEGAMLLLGSSDVFAGVPIKIILALAAYVVLGMVEKAAILDGHLNGLLADVANQVFHLNDSFVPIILMVILANDFEIVEPDSKKSEAGVKTADPWKEGRKPWNKSGYGVRRGASRPRTGYGAVRIPSSSPK
jgi:hypothetical protein